MPTAQQTCCQWFWGRSRARLSQSLTTHIINIFRFRFSGISPFSFEFQELPVTYRAEVRTERGSLSRLGRFCVRQFYQFFLRLFYFVILWIVRLLCARGFSALLLRAQ